MRGPGVIRYRDGRVFKQGWQQSGSGPSSEARVRGIWRGMIKRCDNPNDPSFKRYGGRGIGVCKRWRNSFKRFLADMGPCPAGWQIDRKDSDGDYEPRNCQWLSQEAHHRKTAREAKAKAKRRRLYDSVGPSLA
jgi:hypothetical protein